MVIDCHVHISAFTPPRGFMSRRLLGSIPFRFMRACFGIEGEDEHAQQALEAALLRRVTNARELDAVALLAFDAVYDEQGRLDRDRTHLYVSNDYVIELASRHRQILFAASVHPYRKDAIAEIERCVAAGAVLMKWLPIVQGFDPSDYRCIPFYEALTHHGLPLLCHTGSEHALPNLRPETADPMRLLAALKQGVKVIMAHCGSRLMPWETDFVPTFMRLAREYEHCYGDTAALNVPNRWYAFDPVMNDPVVREKLIHGSDWPILAIPPLMRLGTVESLELMSRERDWLRRDVLIKRALGFDDAYWQRAAKVLRIPNSKLAGGARS